MASNYEIIQAAETLARYLRGEEPTCKECLLRDMCDNPLQHARTTATICRGFVEAVQEWDNEEWTMRKLEAVKMDLEQAKWQMSKTREE